MVESNFKGINLRKQCEKAILIKCIVTFDNLNTHQPNAIDTVTKMVTFSFCGIPDHRQLRFNYRW